MLGSFSAQEQLSGIAVPVELGMAKGWESKSVEEQQSEVREAHKPATSDDTGGDRTGTMPQWSGIIAAESDAATSGGL